MVRSGGVQWSQSGVLDDAVRMYDDGRVAQDAERLAGIPFLKAIEILHLETGYLADSAACLL